MQTKQTTTPTQNIFCRKNITTICITAILSMTSFNLQAASSFTGKTCDSLLKEPKANEVCHLAIKGNAKARYSMAKLFADPKNGSMVNMEYAFFWHLKLARQILKENLKEPGFVNILYNLGVLYSDGLGTKANSKKGFFWFQQAANQGYPLAMTRLFLAYEKGQGTIKNSKKATQWLDEAVKNNNPEAQILMAQKLMEGGKKSESDTNKGVELLKSAAKQNSPKANYILGNYYLMAPNMQKNSTHLSTAKNYFGKSCKFNFLLGCKRYYDLQNPSQTPLNK